MNWQSSQLSEAAIWRIAWEGLEANSGGSSLVIVDTVTLSEAFCNILNLVVDDFSGAVTFVFTYKLSLQWAVSAREFRVGYKYENFQVL